MWMYLRCNLVATQMESRYNSDAIQLKRSRDRLTDHNLNYRFTDKNIDDQIQMYLLCNLDAFQMQFGCNNMKSRYNLDTAQT